MKRRTKQKSLEKRKRISNVQQIMNKRKIDNGDAWGKYETFIEKRKN